MFRFRFECLFFVIITLPFAYGGCVEKPNTVNNRIYFTFEPTKRYVMIPVQLNDSVTANMMLDTGGVDGRFILDSTVFASHPELSFNIPPNTLQVGSGWTSNRVTSLQYKTDFVVKIGNTEFVYNEINIANWKVAMYDNRTEGLFNIPQTDTTHVWELNFENNYLEIHPSENFKFPVNSFVVPMEMIKIRGGYSRSFFVQLPMQIAREDGDTLTMNCKYLIDSAMPWDVVLELSSSEWDFFDKKENDAIWTLYQDNVYQRYYTVTATLFDQLKLDSLRIYIFNKEYRNMGNLIGLHFLKHFNVFFDMKNRQMALQPIDNFQRIISPNYQRCYYWTRPDLDGGKYIIRFIADYKKNYYKTAGLREGDEILTVNGVHLKDMNDMTRKQLQEIYKKDTLYYGIIRDGKSMTIEVLIDKTIEQGD